MKNQEQSVSEKIQSAFDATQKIQKENKAIHNVWYQFYDCDLKEMRKYAKETGSTLGFWETESRMCLQVSNIYNCTIFIYSKKVKIKNHIVIDTAIQNK